MISTVNTILYFEQLRAGEGHVRGARSSARRCSRSIDFIVQALTVVSQLLITGRVAQKLGVTALLVTIAASSWCRASSCLRASGTFLMLAVVMILRRWGEYAFIRPGREMLWSRLDTETKYKAKNFIDVTVYRFSDAVVAQVQDALEGGWHESAAGRLVRRRRMRRTVGGQRLVAGAPVRQGKAAAVGTVRHPEELRAATLRLRHMPSSVIRSYRYDPAAAPPRAAIRFRPPLPVSRRARGNLARHAAGVLQGRVLQRAHSRPLSLHARELIMARVLKNLEQLSLFDTEPSGLAHRAEFISPGEEAKLLGVTCTMPFKPFAFHGWFGKRETCFIRLALRLQRLAHARGAPHPGLPSAAARARRDPRRSSG